LGIAKTYYMFHDVDYYHFIDLAPYTSNIIFAIFECAFPIVTLAIALAGVVDRVNLMGWLFFAGFWHCVVWCPTAHVIWNSGGALYKNFIMDFAGGVVVHIQAAIVVLAFKLVLDRNNKKVDEVPAAARETTSATVAMSLTIVFFATFGFIAGKGHDAGPVAVQAVANTIAAGVAGMLMWFFLDTLAEKEATIVSISQGLLLGLISATPSAGYVTIGGSFCIAIGTVLLTWVGAFFTNERRCQNCSLSIVTLHGVGGILGFFFTSLFSYKMINSAAYNGVMYGRGIPVAYHLAALCIFVPCIFIATVSICVRKGVSHVISHITCLDVYRIRIKQTKSLILIPNRYIHPSHTTGDRRVRVGPHRSPQEPRSGGVHHGCRPRAHHRAQERARASCHRERQR